jgi:hypothetical protein
MTQPLATFPSLLTLVHHGMRKKRVTSSRPWSTARLTGLPFQITKGSPDFIFQKTKHLILNEVNEFPTYYPANQSGRIKAHFVDNAKAKVVFE